MNAGREPFKAGAEVQADDSIGGFFAVVILPEGAFPALQGDNWREITRVQVTDRGDSYYAPGDLVDVKTSLLKPAEDMS